jgi:hypothetical protein
MRISSFLGFSDSSKKSSMKKMPKFPKGLKARIAKAERRKKRDADIAKRKKEIEAARKKLQSLKR